MSGIDDENQPFFLVVNDEGQHSIWPDFKAIPALWRETGFKGLKPACLAHIATVWTDMRSGWGGRRQGWQWNGSSARPQQVLEQQLSPLA